MSSSNPTGARRPTRGRMGTIQQYPKELRDEIDRLLRSNVSQTDIIARLKRPLEEAGEKPLAPSTLNRYSTRMERFGSRIREAREVASVWTAKFGDEPTGEVSQHIIEMLRTIAFDITLRAGDEEDEETGPALDVGAINTLALAVQRLERASEISTKRAREIRREVAVEAEQVAKKAGISDDTAAAIREALDTVDDAGR